uniref:Uncharacterized protein n=1 Tax=Arundo donax TaxID=35708 RepID=A0A0A8XY43_ARUDO
MSPSIQACWMIKVWLSLFCMNIIKEELQLEIWTLAA